MSNIRIDVKIIKILFRSLIFRLLFIIVIISAGFTLLSPYFLTVSNIINVLRQISYTAIIGIGMTFIILSQNIDISVGSVVGFTSVVGALSMKIYHVPFQIALIIALIAATFCGLANGIFVTKLKIPSFIVTLATMSIVRGIAFGISGASAIFGLPELSKAVDFFGAGRISIIPVPIIIMFMLFIIAYLMLSYTRFGSYAYAIGSNEKATRLVGIKTDNYKILYFTMTGFLAGVAGFLMMCRMGVGQANTGLTWEFEVISAVVLGGTSLSGGRGNIWGTLMGAIIVGITRNGLNILSVDPQFQQVAIGLILLGAVAIDIATRRTLADRKF